MAINLHRCALAASVLLVAFVLVGCGKVDRPSILTDENGCQHVMIPRGGGLMTVVEPLQSDDPKCQGDQQ